MSGLLTASVFEPHVGTEFLVVAVDKVHLTLHTASRQPTRPHGDRTEPFSLLFLGPSGDMLPQATYTLEHTELGELDIFLVPVGPDGGGRQQYEAVFN